MKRMSIIIVVLAVLAPTALLASDEVTLEDLAALFLSLSGRTDALEDRLGALEGLFTEDGAVESYENGCLIGIEKYTADALDVQPLRDETVLKYKEQYGDWLDLSEVQIISILYNTDTKAIGIMYRKGWADSGPFVTEEWSECEFVQSSDWWEE